MAYLDYEGLKHLNTRLDALFFRKSRIVNNVTTTSSGKVLDARQGKVLMDAVGKKAAMTNVQLTLAGTAWIAVDEGYTQTVACSGVSATNAVVVAAAPSHLMAYAENTVYCTAQGAGQLTFTAMSLPDQDLKVNVMVLE